MSYPNLDCVPLCSLLTVSAAKGNVLPRRYARGDDARLPTSHILETRVGGGGKRIRHLRYYHTNKLLGSTFCRFSMEETSGERASQLILWGKRSSRGMRSHPDNTFERRFVLAFRWVEALHKGTDQCRISGHHVG